MFKELLSLSANTKSNSDDYPPSKSAITLPQSASTTTIQLSASSHPSRLIVPTPTSVSVTPPGEQSKIKQQIEDYITSVEADLYSVHDKTITETANSSTIVERKT